ncbi:MAG: L-proline glycine betaine binding transporter protein ProX, partial [Aeromicrobium sp.]|nr:L-proline glycine betaine binding transporter protein ProX [Aeromicrobium sp.]
MKHKILIAGAAAAALALTLSACGSSSDSSSGGGSGTIASKLILGGPPEFKTRADGIPGLAKHYGVSFGKYTVTDTGGPVTVNALKNGQVDAADLFTTDPSIEANGFVILTDPKANFAAQNVLPIINKDKATDGVKTTLNGISAKLDTAGLGALMVKVVTDKQDPDAVAKAWLADQGLSTPGTAASGVKLTVGSANFPENVLLA